MYTRILWATCSICALLCVPFSAEAAWSGSVLSTVEINDSTTNGPTLSDSDSFGFSVVNLGDLNGDGVADIAVGALGDEGGSFHGALHIIFMNTDGSVDSIVKINSSTPNGPTLLGVDQFGIDVANIGDINGDGVTDIAVGAYGDDEGGSGRGTPHILFLEPTPAPVASTPSTPTGNGTPFGWTDAPQGSFVLTTPPHHHTPHNQPFPSHSPQVKTSLP